MRRGMNGLPLHLLDSVGTDRQRGRPVADASGEAAHLRKKLGRARGVVRGDRGRILTTGQRNAVHLLRGGGEVLHLLRCFQACLPDEVSGNPPDD